MAKALEGIKEQGDDVFDNAHEKEEEAEAVGKPLVLNKLIVRIKLYLPYI